jgi:hypothetical protein
VVVFEGLTGRLPYGDLALGARFLRSLPGFLRRPIDPQQARRALQQRLDGRAAGFLTTVRCSVFANETSPYLTLLRMVGCEYGDLERLVSQEGVEGALQALCRRGVYLTVDEFKGRRAVVRGSTALAVDPNQLRNRGAAGQVPVQSGGSRGARLPVVVDFAFIRERATDLCLSLEVRGGIPWSHALWLVPGGGALIHLLEFGAIRAPLVRWYSQVATAAPGLHPRYRWSERAIRWGSAISGVRLPAPQYVSLESSLSIAEWMAAVLRAGGTPNLWTFASSAVRLCQTANEAGLDLRGAQILVGGEPLTAARVAAIRQSGAEVGARYGIVETGEVGYGCLSPTAPDDVHLLDDLHALFRVDADDVLAGLSPGTLLMSSIRPSAPVVLLNVSMGDQAEVERRACGCPLEQLGWTTHLHTIRSDEKLTAGGMTFLDSDVVRILEEVLPSRFGGRPTDYQLLEEEAEQGQSELRLLVHPRLGLLEPGEVAETFLAALGSGSGAERVMALQWRQAGLLSVERSAPRVTEAGKILHLHQQRLVEQQPA